MSRDTSHYWVEGRRLPSVTEVLSIAGFSDYSGVDPEVLENARQRGHAVHEYLEGEDVFRLPGDEPPEEIQGYVDAYRRFRDDVGFEIHGNEEVVRSVALGYAGTLDRRGLLAKFDVSAVVDLKCTARLEPSVGPQLAGYELCLSERFERVAVRLLPDGSYRMASSFRRGKEPTLTKSDYSDWLAALRVAHWRIRNGFAQLED